MMGFILKRELLVSIRNPQALLQPILFYLFLVCLFPIATGSDNQTLFKIAPTALWLPLLLATLLASEQLYQNDYQNAILSQDVLYTDLYWVISGKLLASWLRLILPLLVIFPIILLMLHIELRHLFLLLLLMMTGSISLLSLSSIGASLTLGQSQNTFLRFLIILPLYLPVLILGVVTTGDYLLGLKISGHLALFGALAIFSLISAIPFSGLALKSHLLP